MPRAAAGTAQLCRALCDVTRFGAVHYKESANFDARHCKLGIICNKILQMQSPNRWFRLIKGGIIIKNISGRQRATIENCVATIRGLRGVPSGGRLIKGGRKIKNVLGIKRSYNKETLHKENPKEKLHTENLKELLHKGKP